MNNTRSRVTISGRVQGVSFRYYAQRRAAALGVSGWVRNRPGGDVEALIEGEENAVNQMISWCRRGSPNAFVSNVFVENEPYTGEFRSFRIKYW